ncbi:helix-turn-helix transcriptional regulator [Gordonia desulfuricans]|uniref:Helix-turn-helix transcriptional regulator n=1 Tax=Gordonia desulfuricans TaxID=89051 RepID=A0A7K3LS49_9ACTN|nr:helix-turn-helix transcriptional regulator [Gordonia desulfuricans]NDK91103.1 helix-turn-helix transcriptional regulator [Gordonia desulfuricans]
MKTLRAESARASIDALARSGLPWGEFGIESMEILRRAIPFEGVCFGSIDPATDLVTGSVKIGIDAPCEVEFAHHEYVEDNISLFTDLANREFPVSILHEETDDDPRRSSRFRDLFEPMFGFGHEMRAIARAGGRTWGGVALYRGHESSGFSPAEALFLESITDSLALGVRAGLVVSVAESQMHLDVQPAEKGPAVIVFDADQNVISATPAAARRVEELDGDLWGEMPTSVASALGAARALLAGRSTAVPRLIVRGAGGEWFAVHAAPLTGRDGASQTVVTIESAGPSALLPLVVSTFGLTARESEVVGAVLRGDSTTVVAKSLHMSPYTVQDHLKSIFAKAGVSSRRELMSRVYFDHYAPQKDGRLGTDGWFANPVSTT